MDIVRVRPALIASLSRLQIVKYMNFASLAVFVYDYLLTLELELTLIWSSDWSIGKILFLLSRYSTFIDVPLILYFTMKPDIPVVQCSPICHLSTWFYIFGIVMAEAILVLQTYALWACSRRIKIFLVVQYIV